MFGSAQQAASSKKAKRKKKGKGKAKTEVVHISIDHGTKPQNGAYQYFVIPNVTADQTAKFASTFITRLKIVSSEDVQATYDSKLSMVQAVFQKSRSVTIGGITLSVDAPAIVQLQKKDDQWCFVVADPLHDLNRKSITVTVNKILKAGTYSYKTQGMESEHVACQTAVVKTNGNDSTITVNIPDSADAEHYALRQEIYADMPAFVTIPDVL